MRFCPWSYSPSRSRFCYEKETIFNEKCKNTYGHLLVLLAVEVLRLNCLLAVHQLVILDEVLHRRGLLYQLLDPLVAPSVEDLKPVSIEEVADLLYLDDVWVVPEALHELEGLLLLLLLVLFRDASAFLVLGLHHAVELEVDSRTQREGQAALVGHWLELVLDHGLELAGLDRLVVGRCGERPVQRIEDDDLLGQVAEEVPLEVALAHELLDHLLLNEHLDQREVEVVVAHASLRDDRQDARSDAVEWLAADVLDELDDLCQAQSALRLLQGVARHEDQKACGLRVVEDHPVDDGEDRLDEVAVLEVETADVDINEVLGLVRILVEVRNQSRDRLRVVADPEVFSRHLVVNDLLGPVQRVRVAVLDLRELQALGSVDQRGNQCAFAYA